MTQPRDLARLAPPPASRASRAALHLVAALDWLSRGA